MASIKFYQKTFLCCSIMLMLVVISLGSLYRVLNVNASSLKFAYLINVVVTLLVAAFFVWISLLWSRSEEFKSLFSKSLWKLMGKIYIFTLAYFMNVNTGYLSIPPPLPHKSTDWESDALDEVIMAYSFFLFMTYLGVRIEALETKLETGVLGAVHAAAMGYGFAFSPKLADANYLEIEGVPPYYVHVSALLIGGFSMFCPSLLSFLRLLCTRGVVG